MRSPADAEIVIREGAPIDKLFVVLSGALEVRLENGGHVATLGAGEVVGEIAFVDSFPPSATVVAVSRARLLEIDHNKLRGQLDADAAFAARFYKAIAVFLASRLRMTTRRLGYNKSGDLEQDQPMADELDADALGRVAQAGERFNRLLAALGAA